MTFYNAPTISDGSSAPRPRRFSEGMLRMPLASSSSRLGRFSNGLERSPQAASAKGIGSFADGLAHKPDLGLRRRVGRFSDRFEPGDGAKQGAVRSVDLQHSVAERRIAA